MSITSRRQGRPNLGTRPHPRSQENLGRLLHGAGGYRVGRYPLRHGRGKVLAAVGHLGQTSRHRNSRALKLAPKTPVLVPRRRPKPMHNFISVFFPLSNCRPHTSHLPCKALFFCIRLGHTDL
ncbi:hypothetical protein EYR41_005864 [Orbilia oligospora]|uniref:Uncharacterized protein n=1 Tax=Orbilia oligospora TaxID=2813651 RepID=A0A8H2HRZ4_ORBOL|nr:hypothetical protein TWF128_010883 [Orbilia oligospora]TGJ69856.1 hypothetical protein EYR41_005864 [Orbilia oligospora]